MISGAGKNRESTIYSQPIAAAYRAISGRVPYGRTR
jgi:hypothetical protein